MKLTSIVTVLTLGGTAFTAPSDTGTTLSAIDDSIQNDKKEELVLPMPQEDLIEDPELAEPVQYNPFLAVGLSAVLPGSGQIYCKRRVRGAFFMATELITTLYTVNRLNHYRYTLQKNIDNYSKLITQQRDSLSKYTPDLEEYKIHYDNLIDAEMGYDLARYRRRTGRYVTYQGLGWATGFYLWNIWDALGSSKALVSNTPRNPAAAAWLSAIPFLGLGQIYNGSYAKTGLIWTIHTMLAYMAYNYNRLLNDCNNKRHQVQSTQSLTPDSNLIPQYISDWDEEYSIAFRKRNTYLWYLVIFYFYGIFDAAVDAHLHDYKLKIRLNPDIDTQGESIGLNMKVDF